MFMKNLHSLFHTKFFLRGSKNLTPISMITKIHDLNLYFILKLIIRKLTRHEFSSIIYVFLERLSGLQYLPTHKGLHNTYTAVQGIGWIR